MIKVTILKLSRMNTMTIIKLMTRTMMLTSAKVMMIVIDIMLMKKINDIKANILY